MSPISSFMTTEIALTTGITVLAGVVGLLYKRLQRTDATQEKRLVRTEARLDQCEEDRKGLRQQISNIWQTLYEDSKVKAPEEKPPTTPPV